MATYTQPQTFQGVTHGRVIVRLRFEDLASEASLTKTFTFAELRALHPRGYSEIPAQALLTDAQVIRHTDFAGGSISAITASIGDAGAPTELVNAADLFTGAKATNDVAMTVVAPAQYEQAAYGAQVVITAVGDNLDQLTAGDCEFAISYRSFTTTTQS